MRIALMMGGAVMGLVTAAAEASVTPAEMAEMRKWVAVKLENAAPPEPSGSLTVLAHFDAVWRNCRVDRPLTLGAREYRRGLFTHAPSDLLGKGLPVEIGSRPGSALFTYKRAGLGSASETCSGAEPVTAEPERYTLEHCVLEVAAPVEVGRAEGHFWFSSMHPLQGQDVRGAEALRALVCGVVLSDDKPQGKWPAALCLSRDGGASWRRVRDIECYYGPISTLLGPRKILLMPYETWPVSPEDKRNAVADGAVLTLGDDGVLATEQAPVKFCNFPRDLADYHIGEVCLFASGNILPLNDGRLFATVYGKFAGDTKYSVWSVTSDDRGFTWRFQATVANGQELTDAVEGPNESNTARLAMTGGAEALRAPGLVCVYRTGSGADYCKSYSRDEGATWTAPERMDGVFSVEPQLLRLANGVLLLSGGRQGLFVWVCADGEGKKWERVNLAEHHNRHVQDKALHYADAFCEAKGVDPPQSTSYTGMAAVGPNEVLLCYDRLGNGSEGAPGPWGAFDVVFCVRLTVMPSRPQ